MRVYLAGAGNIAERHAESLALLDRDADLYVADPDDETLAAFADRFDPADTYGDVDEMLADPPREDDVLVVAAPPWTHRDLAVRGLERGRHVLCEKPLARSLDEAREMVAAADEHDRLLGSCSCRFLDLPTTARVADLLADDRLGDPYHVTWVDRRQRARPGIEYQPESAWFLTDAKSGGGVLVDWGPYDLALLNDLLSPEAVEVAGAWTESPATAVDPGDDVVFDVETHAGATLTYHLPDGTALPVTYERAHCTHGDARTTFEIEGTRGAVEWEWKLWDGEGRVRHGYDRDGDVAVDETVHRVDDDRPLHARPLRFFTRAVHGEAAPVRTGGDALFDFSVLQAVYDCAATGDPTTVRPE